MRCLSCQRQSFQSASGTFHQLPRPADLNSLNEPPDGGSALSFAEVPFMVGGTIFWDLSLSSRAPKGLMFRPKRHLAGLAGKAAGGALVTGMAVRLASNSSSFLTTAATK